MEQEYGIKREISTITGKPVPTDQERFEGVASLFDRAGMVYNALEPERGPEWQMGYVNPPGIQKALSKNTLTEARKSRKKLYDFFKSRFKKATPTEKELNKYTSDVRAITALPDKLIGNVKAVKEIRDGFWDKALGGKTRAEWTPGQGIIGINKEHIWPDIPHEVAGHSGTESTQGIISGMLKDPKKKELFKSLPEDMQQSIKDTSLIHDFDSVIDANPKLYKTKYYEWPSEIYSRSMERQIASYVKDTGRRVPMQHYMEMQKAAAENGLSSFKRNFQKDYMLMKQEQNKTFKEMFK